MVATIAAPPGPRADRGRRRLPAAVRRSVQHGLILVAVALTVLLSAAVLAGLTALATTSVDSGAAERLAATPGAQVLATANFQAAGIAAADRDLRAASARVFGDVPQRTYLGLLDTTPVSVTGVSGGAGGGTDASVGPGGSALHPVAVQDAAAFGRLLSGRWPAGAGDAPASAFTSLPEVGAASGSTATVDAAVPEQLAQRLGLRPGSVLHIEDAFDRPMALRISGVYRASGAAGFWPGMAGDLSGATGAEQDLLLVSPAALNGSAALNGQLVAHWDVQADLAHLDTARLGGLHDRTRAFSGSQTALSVFQGRKPPLDGLTVVSGLPQAIDALAVPTVVARSALYLPTALLAALALTALVLTARQLTLHRRGELALQQARGAGTVRLLRFAAAEWAVTGIPAAVAAPFLAGLFQPGALGPAAWAASGVTLLVHGASVLLPVLPPLRLRIGRGARAAAAQRTGADLALLAIAGLGYLELRRHHTLTAAAVGDASGGLSVDPVLVLVPVVAGGAAALLLLRLLPLTSRLLDAFGRHRKGLVLPLAGWQLSRRSARNAGPVVLMCLAVSVGALATTALACLDRLAVDQAGFSVGADVRIDPTGSGSYPAAVLGSGYAALPGVTAVAPVTVASANLPGGATEDLVGTISGVAPGAGVSDGGLSGGGRSGTGASGAGGSGGGGSGAGGFGVVLPGRPGTLLLDETLVSDGDTAAPRLRLTLQDAAGLDSTVSTALPAADGARHVVRIPLEVPLSGGLSRSYPLTLTAITVAPEPDVAPARLRLTVHRVGGAGSVAGTGSAAGGGAGGSGDVWAAAVLPSGLGWADRTDDAKDATSGACLGVFTDGYQYGAPGVCSLSGGGTGGGGGADLLRADLSTGFRGSPAGADGLPAMTAMPTQPRMSLQIVAAPTGKPKPLPVRADAVALGDGRLSVGDSTTLDLGTGSGLPVTVVGEVATMPGLGRGQGHLVADQRQLAAALTAAGTPTQDPAFWWLTSRDSARTSAAAAVRPALGSAVTRAQAATALRTDPFRSGLRRVLALSRFLAPCFAVVGFTVHAVISTRERRREFALLRAMGIPVGRLSTLLGAEQLSIALFAVVPGALIGTALAGAVLPLVTVDDTGQPPYPPMRLVLPWADVALTALATAAAICLVVLALARLLARVDLVRVLRAGESG
ncbi:FtsX-like permease family protein [Streptacidiphilus cavernicola]|uniref:FtsX-like permease family protein n=1 Tax=Streptacidiphilus cavernicola TaxID=3342716 RepID=A0ABV6W3H9_9ACTN